MELKPEEALQIAVCQYAEAKRLPFFHFANERKSSWVYGKLLKLMGVKSGVSDCFFPRGNSNFKGLWIELKIKPNKPTVNQVDFINLIIEEGYCAHVAYGIDEAISIINGFYGLR